MTSRVRVTGATKVSSVPLIEEDDAEKHFRKTQSALFLSRINTVFIVAMVIWLAILSGTYWERKPESAVVADVTTVPSPTTNAPAIYVFTLVGEAAVFTRYPTGGGIISSCSGMKRYTLCCDTEKYTVCAYGRGASRTSGIECIMNRDGDGFYASVMMEHPQMLGARCRLYCFNI